MQSTCQVILIFIWIRYWYCLDLECQIDITDLQNNNYLECNIFLKFLSRYIFVRIAPLPLPLLPSGNLRSPTACICRSSSCGSNTCGRQRDPTRWRLKFLCMRMSQGITEADLTFRAVMGGKRDQCSSWKLGYHCEDTRLAGSDLKVPLLMF